LFVGLCLPSKAKDIVLRFIIEYSSLRDFYRPLGNNNNNNNRFIFFNMMIFERWAFWLVLKLEISYNRVIIISWRILVSFGGVFEDYIFALWNIWVSINSSFALRCFFNVNGKARVCDTPPPLLLCWRKFKAWVRRYIYLSYYLYYHSRN